MSDGPADSRLAALWLGALQRLADRAAHEVNNALNGVVVNLEVVRARATPGADAGRVAQFATAASEEGEGATALVAALLALTRPPRGTAGADVALVARQIVTLLAPAVAHQRVAVDLAAADPAPAGGDPLAVRAAVAIALLAAADSAASAVELGGAKHADEPFRRLRGIVGPGPRLAVQVDHSQGITLDADAARTLRDVGVGIDLDGDSVTVTFPPAGGSA